MELLTIPVVTAIVEMLKMTTGLNTKYAPAVSLGIGLVLGLIFVQGALLERIAIGLILGLSASGLYSGYKATTK